MITFSVILNILLQIIDVFQILVILVYFRVDLQLYLVMISSLSCSAPFERLCKKVIGVYIPW